MSKNLLKNNLKEIFVLLKEEKRALIENEGFKIQDIVDKKTVLFEKITQFKGQITEDDWDIIALKKEIDSLQELNLLLTRQALSYQYGILESISENIKKVSTLYSKKGEYGEGESINLINQRV